MKYNIYGAYIGIKNGNSNICITFLWSRVPQPVKDNLKKNNYDFTGKFINACDEKSKALWLVPSELKEFMKLGGVWNIYYADGHGSTVKI